VNSLQEHPAPEPPLRAREPAAKCPALGVVKQRPDAAKIIGALLRIKRNTLGRPPIHLCVRQPPK
jgi:hypothetical protein